MLVIAHKKYYASNDIIHQNPLGQIQIIAVFSSAVSTCCYTIESVLAT